MSLAAPAVPEPGVRYRRTQLGWFMLGIDLVLLLLVGIPAAVTGQAALWLGVALVTALAIVFSTLTVEVTDSAVRFWFGPGFLRRDIPLSMLSGAELADAAWWNGIGIRFTATGLMYNVAVGRTVDLLLQPGKRVRIGTDDPDGLLAAVNEARARVTHGTAAR